MREITITLPDEDLSKLEVLLAYKNEVRKKMFGKSEEPWTLESLVTVCALRGVDDRLKDIESIRT